MNNSILTGIIRCLTDLAERTKFEELDGACALLEQIYPIPDCLLIMEEVIDRLNQLNVEKYIITKVQVYWDYYDGLTHQKF